MAPRIDPHGAKWVVCIDFGTAFSKAAAAPVGAWADFDPAIVRPLAVGAVEPSGNPFLLESAVFVGDTHIVFGAEAVRQAAASKDAKRQALRSFKTLLSVPDLEMALQAQPPRSIEPHRMFRQGELIVLYLAYLTGAIERARVLDPMLAKATLSFRYALPAWRGGKAMHERISGLFAAAASISAKLGDQMFASCGLALDAAAAALKSAQISPPKPMGMIFEATAAASCCLIGLDAPAPHLMVVDMGAGTTDFAALARNGDRLDEVGSARVTLMQAGDVIDRILLDLALAKAVSLKAKDQQAELWRSLLFSVREVKENLLLDGRCVISLHGQDIVLTLKDLTKDRDFKAFSKQLKEAFAISLNALAARAARDNSKAVAIIAVGGGAEAPFIKDMVKTAKAPRVRTVMYPATPDWAHSAAFGGNLAAIFPQLAIAIGGALAPDSLLAAVAKPEN